jgi:cardiolipin synthase
MRIGAFSLWLFMMLVTAGCVTTLPDAKSMLRDMDAGEMHPAISGAHGLLPPHESGEVMDRLMEQSGPTDVPGRQTALMELVSGNPLTSGNKAVLLIDGPATYAAAVKAIEGAKESINFESYIIDDDQTGNRLADLLLRKSAEGVKVNLIYDSFGSLRTSSSYFKRLREGGVNVLEFSPLNPLHVREAWRPFYRDHRKVLIADGKKVITGGVNISREFPGRRREKEESEKIWRDTDVMIEGPAVAEFQRLFMDTWKQQKGPQLPEGNYYPPLRDEGDDLVSVAGNTPGGRNRATYIMYVAAITYSNKSVHITDAYFVPDVQVMEALTDAARRGVDVKLILAGRSDFTLPGYAGRYYYTRLLKAGVKIYEFQKRILHAKTAVVDGVWSTVGSSNMDFWSFARNDEENAIILGRDFGEQMEAMFSRDLAESREVLLDQWEKRPLPARLREWFLHLFAPWL